VWPWDEVDRRTPFHVLPTLYRGTHVLKALSVGAKACSGGRFYLYALAAGGLVSRVTPVHTAMRNSTRDEGGPFEVDNQVLISSHRKLLWSKAMVVSVAEKPKQDSGRHD
jgi:hypothetical protein